MIDLFEFSDHYTLRLINVIIMLAAIAFWFYARKGVQIFIKRLDLNKGVTVNGKSLSLQKILYQVIWIISILILYAGIGFDNPKFSLSTILNYTLIEKQDEESFGLNIGQIFGIILVLFITRVIASILRLTLTKTLRNKDWIDESRIYTIAQLSKYIIYVIGVVFSLKILFGSITGLLFGGSAIFVGLGLGMQEFFTDVVSGFILLNDGSVKVGDIVELNGEVSKVIKISIRTSHVKTTDGKIIIVPNSKFTEELVTNWSISDKINRFHISVSVAYGTDTAKVKDLLYNVALAHPKVQKNKEVIIMLDDFGDSGIHFKLYFWAEQAWEILVIKSDLRFAIDAAFREHDISIPYPQMDVHLKKEEA